jgi:hypothetical protein
MMVIALAFHVYSLRFSTAYGRMRPNMKPNLPCLHHHHATIAGLLTGQGSFNRV